MRNSMWIRRKAWIFVTALVLGIPVQGAAQQKLSIEGRGGIAVPASDLADLLDVGPSFGGGIAYDLGSRIALRVDGDVDILSGADSSGPGPEGPDMTIFHYNAGLAARLIDPTDSRWNLDVNVGGGASTFDSDSFQLNGTTTDFSETYFTVNGGLRIGYDVSSTFNVFLGGQAYLIFTDEDDTAVLAQIQPEVDPNGFDNAWTFPLTLGIALRF